MQAHFYCRANLSHHDQRVSLRDLQMALDIRSLHNALRFRKHDPSKTKHLTKGRC